MFGVRGGGDILTSSVLKFSAAGRAFMPEECLRARAALWQGCSACPAVLTAARDALELWPSKCTVGFAVPPRPEPRRSQQLSVLKPSCLHEIVPRSAHDQLQRINGAVQILRARPVQEGRQVQIRTRAWWWHRRPWRR